MRRDCGRLTHRLGRLKKYIFIFLSLSLYIYISCANTYLSFIIKGWWVDLYETVPVGPDT